jgi:hypothetical protein
MLRFTDPSGQDVYIAREAIVRLKSPTGFAHANAGCIIDFAGGQQAVKETVEEVLFLIGEPRSK